MTPGMTLLEAIAGAGGLTDYANTKKIYILRERSRKAREDSRALQGSAEGRQRIQSGSGTRRHDCCSVRHKYENDSQHADPLHCLCRGACASCARGNGPGHAVLSGNMHYTLRYSQTAEFGSELWAIRRRLPRPIGLTMRTAKTSSVRHELQRRLQLDHNRDILRRLDSFRFCRSHKDLFGANGT